MNFFKKPSAGGIILLICAAIALLAANTHSLHFIHEFWHKELSLQMSGRGITMSVSHWINDGLMALFFFSVGLEIKREMLVGELSSPGKASLPIVAAAGGMILPALIYLFFNAGTEWQNGWGIPMATDIAFAMGIISILGNRVPPSLKIFLMALAIVDDLGAILVLAIFYPTAPLNFTLLILAAVIFMFLLLLNRLNVQNGKVYLLTGVLLWIIIFYSGIHATIAGVLLAITIPSSTAINEVRFIVGIRRLIDKFSFFSDRKIKTIANKEQLHIIDTLHQKVKKATPLLHKFEHALHPWVAFFIMPVFALANAGVVIDSSAISLPPQSITSGIFFGLFLGKPFGILLFSLAACKLKISTLPANISWIQIFSVGIIAGIGFTMSIFINNLAFLSDTSIDLGKIAVLITSLVSAIIGGIMLRITTKAPEIRSAKKIGIVSGT